MPAIAGREVAEKGEHGTKGASKTHKVIDTQTYALLACQSSIRTADRAIRFSREDRFSVGRQGGTIASQGTLSIRMERHAEKSASLLTSLAHSPASVVPLKSRTVFSRFAAAEIRDNVAWGRTTGLVQWNLLSQLQLSTTRTKSSATASGFLFLLLVEFAMVLNRSSIGTV